VAHRGQGLHRQYRREVGLGFSQSLVEESLNQECQCGDKDMCPDLRLDLAVNRPHAEDILEVAKFSLDVSQVLLDRDRVPHAQRLFGSRDHIFRLDSFLVFQRPALAELKFPITIQLVSVIALSMVLAENLFSGLDDLVAVLDM
jgi:hypothetical protein